MGLSYLSQDDITQWAPWFWVIMAYKWTADQGKTLPALSLAWRSEHCDVDEHACTLLQSWFPQATDIEVLDATDYGMSLKWRDGRINAWLRMIRDPQTPRDTRKAMAQAYDHVWRRIRARIDAKMKGAPWLEITFRADTFTWLFDVANYGDYWDDPPVLDFVHWLESLEPILKNVPEVTAS